MALCYVPSIASWRCFLVLNLLFLLLFLVYLVLLVGLSSNLQYDGRFLACFQMGILWHLFVILVSVTVPASAGGALAVLLALLRYETTGLLLLPTVLR